MATVTIKSKPAELSPIESVTLTLNEAEYNTLLTVLNRVDGSSFYSPRKHVRSILANAYAAEQMRLLRHGHDPFKNMRQAPCLEATLASDYIYFDHYPEEK